jgi:ATP-dependent DNA helicase RecG
MIIHGDYRATSDSVVKVFDDKIEFYNPGKLPDGITIQNLIDNNYKSTPRNKVIAEFFKNLGWIEKYGSGIGRIINYFKDEQLAQPKFEILGEGFQVTVFNKQHEDNSSSEGLNKGLNELLLAIERNGGIKAKELSILLNNRPIKTIERQIMILTKKGLIERRGSKKTGGYYNV